MSLSPFACSLTISISGAKGGSHVPTSLIASLDPPGLDAIPGQKALTSDHKRVLWCASSATRLRSGTLRLYKAGLQKRLVLFAISFSLMQWLRFGCVYCRPDAQQAVRRLLTARACGKGNVHGAAPASRSRWPGSRATSDRQKGKPF